MLSLVAVVVRVQVYFAGSTAMLLQNPQKGRMTFRRGFLTMAAGMGASLPLVTVREGAAFEASQGGRASDDRLVTKEQGRFMVCGTVLTAGGQRRVTDRAEFIGSGHTGTPTFV
jgi:hypothetical protein